MSKVGCNGLGKCRPGLFLLLAKLHKQDNHNRILISRYFRTGSINNQNNVLGKARYQLAVLTFSNGLDAEDNK